MIENKQTEWNSFLYLFVSSGILHLMARSRFNVNLVASAAAAAPNSNGSDNHDKRMIRFSGMQGGEKSMNEKRARARGHAVAQFILALNSICQPNGNREGTERRQKMVWGLPLTRSHHTMLISVSCFGNESQSWFFFFFFLEHSSGSWDFFSLESRMLLCLKKNANFKWLFWSTFILFMVSTY